MSVTYFERKKIVLRKITEFNWLI